MIFYFPDFWAKRSNPFTIAFRQNCSIPEDCKSCPALGFFWFLWSIEFVHYFCKHCRLIEAEARASWLSAEKEPAPKRLPRCPMSPYCIVFYDFDFLCAFCKICRSDKAKICVHLPLQVVTTDKKAPAPKRLPQCPMWPYYKEFYDFACLRFLGKAFKSIYHCVWPKLQHPGGR